MRRKRAQILRSSSILTVVKYPIAVSSEMKHLPACTIVSNNYLAMAQVFAASYKEHHPGAEVYVCIVDRPSPEVRYQELPFRTIFAQDLPVPAFFNMAFRYGILELNTAVKPYLLAHLRDEFGLDRALYFDPDILVLNALDELSGILENHTAVLTPHITQGLDDSYAPSEKIIQMSGIYNLGFLGLRLDDSTSGFLQWWQERLYRFCLHDIQNGVFVDQKWMDLAPAFLPSVSIERDPAYNIAYWNLPHRKLQKNGDDWFVNGRRAGFFHFSGVVFDHLDAISRYQNRVSSGTHPEVVPLFNEYKDRVAAAGHDEMRLLPYGFGTFETSGIPVSPVLRKALQRIDPYGLRWPNPFDDERADSFLAWLTAPIEFRDGWLNRAALCLWEEREDLVHGFRSPWGADLRAYAAWVLQSTTEQRTGISTALLSGVRVRETGSSPSRQDSLPEILPYDSRRPGNREPMQSIDLAAPSGATTWLNEAVPAIHEWPLVTRLGMKLYETREDVQRAFPDPIGADQVSFTRWLILSAGPEYHLHEDLLRPIINSFPLRERIALMAARFGRRSKGARTHVFTPQQGDGNHPMVRKARSLTSQLAGDDPAGELPEFKPGMPRDGVNLAGYFEAGSGVGQAVRGTAAALAHAGIPVARVPLDVDPWLRSYRGKVFQPSGSPFDITLMHVNADETPRALRMVPAATAAATFKIGYWFWELSHFPIQFADRFNYLDELWAPTRFCQKSFEVLSTIPVRYVPPCVLPPTLRQTKRSRFGMQENRFYFSFAFDVFSIPERKNPIAVIDAFILAASRTRRDIGLIINVNQASHNRELVQRLRDRAKNPKIIIHTDPLNRAEIESLLICSDAYVSLHRSEGLGLPPIEALYLSKPIIATNYGGVTDFLDSTTGFPVAFTPVQLGEDFPPYPAGAIWADPDVDDAANAILRVVEDPEECANRAGAGFERVSGMYGIDAAADRFERELKRLFSRAQVVKDIVPAANPGAVALEEVVHSHLK